MSDKWKIPTAVISGLCVGVLIIVFVTLSVDLALRNTNAAEIDPSEYTIVNQWAKDYPAIHLDLIKPRLMDNKINRKEFNEIKSAVEVKQRQGILDRLMGR